MKVLTCYIATALWCSTAIGAEQEHENFDRTFEDLNYSECDLSDELREQAIEDLAAFKDAAEENGIDLCDFDNWPHDFWLTRNRHGAGFWDGDYPEDVGQKLTDLSHKFREIDLYLGSDGKIYAM